MQEEILFEPGRQQTIAVNNYDKIRLRLLSENRLISISPGHNILGKQYRFDCFKITITNRDFYAP